jgi:spore coat polysaccharide biosynthesis protein SpsF
MMISPQTPSSIEPALDLTTYDETFGNRPGALVRPVAFVEARMGSTELPGRALLPILGRPLLWHVIDRVRQASQIAEVVVLTTDSPRDMPIRSYCRRQGIEVFAGNERDATDRLYRAAIHYRANPIVRLEAEAAFVDPTLVDQLLSLYSDGEFDYAKIATGAGSIFLEGGRYPEGMGAQVIGLHALERTWSEATDANDRGAVTAFVERAVGRFRVGTLRAEQNLSHLRLTIENEGDLELARQVYGQLGSSRGAFTLEQTLAFLNSRPELLGLARRFSGAEAFQPLAA